MIKKYALVKPFKTVHSGSQNLHYLIPTYVSHDNRETFS